MNELSAFHRADFGDSLDGFGIGLDIEPNPPVFLQAFVGTCLRFTKMNKHFTVSRFLCFPGFHRYNSLFWLFLSCCSISSSFYKDCRQHLRPDSISKRTPQISGSDLKVLAGTVSVRTNTVLLSTFLDNQSPLLFFPIVVIPFRLLIVSSPFNMQYECQ